MALPNNIEKQIEQDAVCYASVQCGDPAKFQMPDESILWNNAKTDYIAGATEYATKSQQCKALLDEAQALLSKERDKAWKLVEALGGIKQLLEDEIVHNFTGNPKKIEKKIDEINSLLSSCNEGKEGKV